MVDYKVNVAIKKLGFFAAASLLDRVKSGSNIVV